MVSIDIKAIRSYPNRFLDCSTKSKPWPAGDYLKPSQASSLSVSFPKPVKDTKTRKDCVCFPFSHLIIDAVGEFRIEITVTLDKMDGKKVSSMWTSHVVKVTDEPVGDVRPNHVEERRIEIAKQSREYFFKYDPLVESFRL